jgi:hypothetical protein
VIYASDFAPAQDKPRCITLIFQIFIYLNVVHLCCRNFMIPTCIYIYIYIYIYLYIYTHESY